jgi:hypothetical protein
MASFTLSPQVRPLLATFELPRMGLGIALLMVICLLLIAPFPAFFLYQIRLWKKWARKTREGKQL